MTDRRVALLRGINVGRAKRISMGDLRALFAGLGYGDVRTLLNSGNIVFTVAKRNAGDQADRIERAIAERLGVTTRVTILRASEVAEAIRENPLEDGCRRSITSSVPGPSRFNRAGATETAAEGTMGTGSAGPRETRRVPVVRTWDQRQPPVDGRTPRRSATPERRAI